MARDEEHEGSDIDFLVDSSPGRSLFDHAQLVDDTWLEEVWDTAHRDLPGLRGQISILLDLLPRD